MAEPFPQQRKQQSGKGVFVMVNEPLTPPRKPRRSRDGSRIVREPQHPVPPQHLAHAIFESTERDFPFGVPRSGQVEIALYGASRSLERLFKPRQAHRRIHCGSAHERMRALHWWIGGLMLKKYQAESAWETKLRQCSPGY
jgi:hypothetical protein